MEKTLFIVRFMRQDYDANPRWFEPEWDLVRKQAVQIGMSLPADASPEWIAEKLFHLTNAPDDCLSEEDAALVRQMRGRGLVGPSLSVGDVVEVKTAKNETHLLCKNIGWESKVVR